MKGYFRKMLPKLFRSLFNHCFRINPRKSGYLNAKTINSFYFFPGFKVLLLRIIYSGLNIIDYIFLRPNYVCYKENGEKKHKLFHTKQIGGKNKNKTMKTTYIFIFLRA